MIACPKCLDYNLIMFEHYEKYNDDETILCQDQVFECCFCSHIFIRTVWYKQTAIEWLPDEED